MNELEEAGLRLKLAAAERERDEFKKQLQAWEANATYSINLGIAAATEKLTNERDTLAAKCAEMRRQLGAIKHAIEHNQPIPWQGVCERIGHALSSDCGRDYVPRSQLDAVKAALKECVEALENYGNHRTHCQLGYSDQKCNCGFYEALAKAKEVLK